MWRSMYRSTSRGKSAPANAVILALLPTNMSLGPCATEYTIAWTALIAALSPVWASEMTNWVPVRPRGFSELRTSDQLHHFPRRHRAAKGRVGSLVDDR